MSEKGLKLSDDQIEKLSFSAFEDALDFLGSIEEAQNESNKYSVLAWQSGVTAKQISQNADDIVRSSWDKLNAVREEAKSLRGEQIVEMGSSGFFVGSRSYRDIIDETDRNLEINLAAIRENTMNEYAKAKYNQRIQEIQQKLYKKSAKLAKFNLNWGSLVSAGVKAISISGGK